MFCKNCGKEICDEAVICIGCGCVTKDELLENKPKGNGMAIAGFVCSFFYPILGWIFGGIGLAKAKKRNGKGKGFSIAALSIATAYLLITIIAILAVQ